MVGCCGAECKRDRWRFGAIAWSKARSGLRPATRQGAFAPWTPTKGIAFGIHPVRLWRGGLTSMRSSGTLDQQPFFRCRFALVIMARPHCHKARGGSPRKVRISTVTKAVRVAPRVNSTPPVLLRLSGAGAKQDNRLNCVACDRSGSPLVLRRGDRGGRRPQGFQHGGRRGPRSKIQSASREAQFAFCSVVLASYLRPSC